MPSIVFRYILKTLLMFFAGALIVLSSVFFIQNFIKLFGLAMHYGADIWWVFGILLRVMPEILSLTAPMAFQLAVLLTLTSMGESGEIMALRASGFSFKEITMPLIITASVLTMILLYTNNFLSPESTKVFLDERKNVRNKMSNITIEPKTMVSISGFSLYAEEVSRNGKKLKQVLLISNSDKGALNTKINAATGYVKTTENSIILELFNGQMQRISGVEESQIILANFESYRIPFALSLNKSPREMKVEELTLPEIISYISKEEDSKKRANAKTAFSMRQVLALSPVILLLLSCPIGLNLGRKSKKSVAMLYSVVIILLFYVTMMLGITLGKKYEALAYYAPFIPVIAGLVLSIYLWKKKLNK
ncbi:lipopolysaccharide export system permease protein [Parelusimicrobium proximum]|uniref:LptF/LptG family permease n=1 Tax=Parelusimicrobium proximum TaxID=3228953 RepID=UPI003D16E3D5